MWRVGDGRSIKIWEDKWVESPITYSIQSPVRILDRGANWWNVNMLTEIFSEEEAAKIGGMAICPSKPPDQQVWVGNKNGDFSVRSEYHLGRERCELAEGGSSIPSSMANIWKKIWTLRVP